MLAVHNNDAVVLLQSVIKQLNIIPDGIYIDGTFGQGGHSRVILSNLNQYGRLLAIDRDLSSIRIGKMIANQDSRLIIIHGQFSKLFKYVKKYNVLGKVNGVLLDLGLSRLQLEQIDRGFSFINDGILDMRMDTSRGISAAMWLHKAPLENIFWVLKTFGEEKFSRKIARAIVEYRKTRVLTRTSELVALIMNTIPYYDQHKHAATRVFQAIRIYINNELDELKKVLKAALFVLAPRGRLLVISFHSLEDRMVKSFIRTHSAYCFDKSYITDRKNYSNMLYNFDVRKHKLIFLEKIMPSQEDIKKNISVRSAILRSSEKIII